MVNELRRRLLQVDAPTPSVETLLHAFLPHKFVDHTHADAICALSNQPDGERRIRDALGADVAVLPWIMPGFPLAKAVADAFEAQPEPAPEAEPSPIEPVDAVAQTFPADLTDAALHTMYNWIEPRGLWRRMTHGGLAEAPDGVNADCYGDGWMIVVRLADESELEQLLHAADYAQHVKDRE